MINLKLNRKSASPLAPFRRPAPAKYFNLLFSIFQIPPSAGGNQNLLPPPPPLKRGWVRTMANIPSKTCRTLPSSWYTPFQHKWLAPKLTIHTSPARLSNAMRYLVPPRFGPHVVTRSCSENEAGCTCLK